MSKEYKIERNKSVLHIKITSDNIFVRKYRLLKCKSPCITELRLVAAWEAIGASPLSATINKNKIVSMICKHSGDAYNEAIGSVLNFFSMKGQRSTASESLPAGSRRQG